MKKGRMTGAAAAVALAPKRWLYNIIAIQEKKEYNFYVILLFSLFIGITRFMLEFILCHQTLCMLNIVTLNFVMFYLHTIFLYTLVLRIFVPGQPWQKSIHLVLIGVFLGIFPPVIDSFVYGVGQFMYQYSKNFPDDWRLFLYNEKINCTVGETAVLFLTIFFTAAVVFIKTRKILRSAAAFLAAYGIVVFYSQVLPTIAYNISEAIRMSGAVPAREAPSLAQELSSISGFSTPYITPMLQLLVILIVYLILNPLIAKNLLKRINHAAPAGLTALLGYSLHRPVDGYGTAVAVFFIFAFLTATMQNDYFDRVEDEVEGREPYLSRNDVSFFNAALLVLVAMLLFAGNVIGYFLLLFLVVSFLYNYDFYRAKKYFPANNKIEGVAGASSFLGGLCMAFIVDTKGSGDILNIVNLNIVVGSGAFESMLKSIREFWTLKYILIAFLVFGGWFVISIIKDYKDINGDAAAGNQTVYTMLQKRNRDYLLFHRLFSLLVFALLIIPPVWLAMSGLEPFFIICMIFADAALLFVITRKNAKRAVTLGFLCLNVYLLWLVIGNHMLNMAR